MFSFTSINASEETPDMRGRVVNEVTGAGVPGVWVKWTNGPCDRDPEWCPPCVRTRNSRYARTDANGDFVFPMRKAYLDTYPDLGRMIDTNLDGTNDAQELPATDPTCNYANGSIAYSWIFSCFTKPHDFSVVKPAGWGGSFSEISDYEINNSNPDDWIGELIYTPPITTNTSTPTRTPTPVGGFTPTLTATPIPTFTPTPTPIPVSCTINGVPGSISVAAGSSVQIITNSAINPPAGGSVDQVTFTPSNSSIAVCPFGSGPCSSGGAYTDTTSSFSIDVTGITPGNSTIQVQGRMVDEGVSCPVVSTNVTVDNPASWWQVMNGDAITNGSLQSTIPSSTTCSGTCSPVFSLSTSGNSEGIPTAPGSASFGSGAVSSSLRLAKADYRGEVPPYSFSHFKNLYGRISTISTITGPNPTTNLSGGTSVDGYIYFRYVGTGGSDTLTISGASGIDLGSNKVILLVENANVTIASPIRLTKGRGFFALISEKNISVAASIAGDAANPGLSGIFATDNEFRTGSLGIGLDSSLYVRGSVKAGTISTNGAISGGVVLERNLTNNANKPGEVFEFAPDILLSFPSALGESKVEWREVAP